MEKYTQNEYNAGTPDHVLEVCDVALSLAGYKILDGDEDCIFIKYDDKYFEVKVIKCVDC